MNLAPLRKRPTWLDLEAHIKTQNASFPATFADDPQRNERMTVKGAGVYLDYSKNRVTDETLKLLLAVAEESCLRKSIDAMFRGEKLNITEQRAVLQITLRAPQRTTVVVDGENVVARVHAV